MFCHEAGLRSGRLGRSGSRSQGIAASFRSTVPDAPLPEGRASRAHNARARRRAGPGKKAGNAAGGPDKTFVPRSGASRASRDLCRSVMECHDVSCFVMRPCGMVMFCNAPPGRRPRLCGPVRVSAAGARRSSSIAASGVRGSFTVIRAISFGARGGTGCSCFARIVRRCVRGRAAAGRAEGAPLPPAYAGAFAAPQPWLSAEKRKGGPGSRLSLPPLYTISLKIKPFRKQNGNIGQFSYNPLNRQDNYRLSIRRFAPVRDEMCAMRQARSRGLRRNGWAACNMSGGIAGGTMAGNPR